MQTPPPRPRDRVRTLSIAAPAYDEQDALPGFVATWAARLEAGGYDAAEVVVCDDGSRDGSGALLGRLAAEHPALRVVTHATNRGAGAAMASAIAATRHAWVLLVDADGQFPVGCLDALERVIEASGEGELDAVLGARAAKRDTTFARAGSRLSNLACNTLLGSRLDDFSSTCRLVRGDLLRRLPLEARGLNYSLDVTARLLEAGARVVETPVPHDARGGGRSSRTAVRSSVDRALFVAWLGARRALARRGVLMGAGATAARPR